MADKEEENKNDDEQTSGKSQEEKKEEVGKHTDSSEGKSLLEQHKEEREKMEKVVEGMKKENERAEKAIAESELEGKGFSGIGKEKKEETSQEYVDRVSKAGWRDDRKT